MGAKKGQMFVVIAIFLTGLIFTVQTALITYSVLDISGPYQTREHYLTSNIIDELNSTIRSTANCDSFGNNLREMLTVFRDDLTAEGYLMDVNYDLNCTFWNTRPPARAPLRASITFTGAYDSSGLFSFYHL